MPVRGFARSLYKGAILNNLKFPFRIIRSAIQVKRIFRRIKPALVIATGGYVSGVPGWEAIRRNIPLYLQEQNAWPGITTRLLAKHARIVFYAYPDILNHLPIRPGTRYVYAPNPVRNRLHPEDKNEALKKWHLDPKRKTLFVFGGSQGALNINQEVLKYVRGWVSEFPWQVIWQTGERHYKQMKEMLKEARHIHLYPFIEDMGSAYSAADLVMCRAGALTLVELEHLKKPAILIPLPSAAANHQYFNALALQKKGVAHILTEDTFKNNTMDALVRELMTRPELIEDLRDHFSEKVENGLEIIVENIMKDLPF